MEIGHTLNVSAITSESVVGYHENQGSCLDVSTITATATTSITASVTGSFTRYPSIGVPCSFQSLKTPFSEDC